MSKKRPLLEALKKLEAKGIEIDEVFSGLNNLGFEIPGRSQTQDYYPSFWLNDEEKGLEIVIRIALGSHKLDVFGKKIQILCQQWQEVIDETKYDIISNWEFELESKISLPDVNEPEDAWFELEHWGFAYLKNRPREVDEAVRIIEKVLTSDEKIIRNFFFLED